MKMHCEGHSEGPEAFSQRGAFSVCYLPYASARVRRSVGGADGERVVRLGYDGGRLGVHHGVHRRLLRLRSPVGRAASAQPRRQQRDRRGGHRMHPGGAVGNRKRHHLLQPEHRRSWHHQSERSNSSLQGSVVQQTQEFY